MSRIAIADWVEEQERELGLRPAVATPEEVTA
jgi:hypothetical protein